MSRKDVRQGLRDCKTVRGSKICRQFCDVGVSGDIRMRKLSCHKCECCMKLNAGNCARTAEIGPPDVVKMEGVRGAAAPKGKHALQQLGRELSATVVPGDVVCVELAGELEEREKQPWMLGIAENAGTYVVEEEHESMFGKFKPGDVVIDVQKLEPLAPASRFFVPTDRCFPVFVEDVRKVKIKLKSRRRTRAADQRRRFELEEDDRDDIESMMSQ